MTDAASDGDLREHLSELLDEFGVPEFTWKKGETDPVIEADPMKRLRSLLKQQTSPASKTAFVCVQLLNAVRHLRRHLECSCNSTGAEHKLHCVCWQTDFLISAYEQDFFPKDAEVWMRAVTLIAAIQRDRKRGMRLGYAGVREIPLDELAELANGHPVAVTDAYAAMESLRTVIGKMREELEAGTARPGKKADRAMLLGRRQALKRWLPHLEEIVNAQSTDICAGLIETFAAWLTTQEEAITVGRKHSAEGIARAVNEFISSSHLRRRPQKGQSNDEGAGGRD